MRNRLSSYSRDCPPTDEEFAEIGAYLLAKFNAVSDIQFRIAKSYVEPKCWITLEICAERVSPLFGALSFIGTLSYGVRRSIPKADILLLAFSQGKRIYQGELSVLESEFHLSQDTWATFHWERDIYGEWECEDLPPK
jgi:hypothetical protein